MKAILLNLFFPVNCASCGGYVNLTSEYGICRECVSEIAPVYSCGCRFCGSPVDSKTEFCRICAANQSYIDDFYTAFYYEGTVRNIIKKYKYGNARYVEKLLVDYLVNLFNKYIQEREKNRIVVPVSLHRRKLKERGFNQSEALAARLSKALRLKTVPRAIIRTRNTEPQYTKNRQERFSNVKNAFSASRKLCAGKDIVLLDDVSTTGATIQQAAAALRSAGAKRITAVTVAHGRLRDIQV